VYEKRCPDCDTTHSYGRVVTAPAVLLLPVERVTRPPVHLVELKALLKQALPIDVRLVARRPDLSTPRLTRGFDHPAVSLPWHVGAWESIGAVAGAVAGEVLAHLAPLAPEAGLDGPAAAAALGARIARYRVAVLDEEWFVPSVAISSTFGHAHRVTVFHSELLALTTSLLERTQVGFGGTCMSLHTAAGRGGSAPPLLDKEVLARAWFEREALALCRQAGVAPGSADGSYDVQSPSSEATLMATYTELKGHFRRVWAEGHDRQCTRRGNCRLLVMDGNAKVWRRTCSQRYRFYDSACSSGVVSNRLYAGGALPLLRPFADQRCVWTVRSSARLWLGPPGLHITPKDRLLRLHRVPGRRRRAVDVRAVRARGGDGGGGGACAAPRTRRGRRLGRSSRGDPS
jgi:hypothetical protein